MHLSVFHTHIHTHTCGLARRLKVERQAEPGPTSGSNAPISVMGTDCIPMSYITYIHIHIHIPFQKKSNTGIHFNTYAKERLSQRECRYDCHSIIPSIMDSVPADLQVRVRLLQEKRRAFPIKRLSTSEIENGFWNLWKSGYACLFRLHRMQWWAWLTKRPTTSTWTKRDRQDDIYIITTSNKTKNKLRGP
jgi:hypothetical protein